MPSVAPAEETRSAARSSAVANNRPTRSGRAMVSASKNSNQSVRPSQSSISSAAPTPRCIACTLPAHPSGGPSLRSTLTRGSSAACFSAIAAVSSVESSSTTRMRNAWCRWARRALKQRPMVVSSLRAGMTMVTSGCSDQGSAAIGLSPRRFVSAYAERATEAAAINIAVYRRTVPGTEKTRDNSPILPTDRDLVCALSGPPDAGLSRSS